MRLKTTTFVFLLGLAFSSAVWAEENCQMQFEDMAPMAQKAGEKVALKYSRYQYSMARGFIQKTRDGVRRWLQVKHEHAYPVIALDDATPVNAYALAADAFNDLPEEQKTLVNIGNIKADLESTLASVEGYPQRLKDFIDETSSLAAQEKALETYLARGNVRSYGLTVEMPVIKTGEDGKQILSVRNEYFGTDIEMKLRLKEIKKELDSRLGNHFFSLNETNNVAMAQAINVKRLETFRHEILRQTSLHPGQKLPEDVQAMLDRINALFKDPNAAALKDELRPPVWAWDRLGWMQLNGEVKAVISKDLPKLKDEALNNQVIQFINNLSPEDKRALGLTNAAKAATFVQRTKWFNFITTVGTGTGGTVAILKGAYNFFMTDRRGKENCAAKTDDAAFVACAQAQLQTEFAPGMIAAILNDREAFLNPDGKITNKKVLKEIKDMLARRKAFARDQNRDNEAVAALSKFMSTQMATGDISSVPYRKALIETQNDESFYVGLMGSDQPKVESYLGFEYPLYFAKDKDLIGQIVHASYGSPEQTKLAAQLKDDFPELATELLTLLKERNDFKSGKPIPEDNPYYRRPIKSLSPRPPAAPPINNGPRIEPNIPRSPEEPPEF